MVFVNSSKVKLCTAFEESFDTQHVRIMNHIEDKLGRYTHELTLRLLFYGCVSSTKQNCS